MFEKSRLADIHQHLELNGYEVYFPAQKVGECLKPYIVVKDEGSTRFQTFSSQMRLYAIMCYVPENQFSNLEPMVMEVEAIMLRLFPMITSNNFHTPSFYDDTVKAHMISMQYRNIRQNQRRI